MDKLAETVLTLGLLIVGLTALPLVLATLAALWLRRCLGDKL